MKTNHYLGALLIFVFTVVFAAGCKKENGFLDTKPNQALAVPTSVSDLQLLINNEAIFNRFYPALGEASTDDINLDASIWLSDLATDKNAYIWAKEVYAAGANVQDWSFPYQMVYYANTVLTTLPNIAIGANEQSAANTVKGSAYFFRAVAFFNLLQVFSMPYDTVTSAQDLGIPLRLTTDLNAKVPRSTVNQCYSQIIADLNAAEPLLQDQPTSITKPSKAAVYGLLSRIYLSMDNYTQSLNYASKFLTLHSQLQDFNKLSLTAFPVYPNYSPEEVFHAGLLGYKSIGFNVAVDSNLYKLYNDPNDLRLAIYFRKLSGRIEFRSQFDRKSNTSSTISTDEIYLTKAECEARLNNTSTALADLNSLLLTRWKTGTYKPLTANSAIEALQLILTERRKELVLTSLRWLDLRRLNKDPRFAITLYRNLSGVTYSLPPNDPRYALPIPNNEIQVNPIPQNNR
jgi:hypothetical protein